MTRALCLGLFATMLLLPAAAGAATTCAGGAPSGAGLAPDIVSAAQQPHGYPSFCDIPRIPTDVRGATQWKAAVNDTRLAGARLQRQTAADSWTLDQTDSFATGARGDAAPPPPMTPATEDDTAAFARQLKQRATPPPRPH